MRTTRTTIAVLGGAAALTLGVAAPAVAHDSGGSVGVAGRHQHPQPSLADAKAWAGKALDREASRLTKAKAAVAADDNLSSAEKATWTAKIDAALQKVAAARTAVGDATTVAQVRAAVASASPRMLLPHPDKPTLASQKEHATTWLDAAAAKLAALQAKVAGDDTLTDAQKAAFTARIDKQLADIAAARTAVSQATTEAQLRAALARAHAVPLHYPDRHRGRDQHASSTNDNKVTTVASRTAKGASARSVSVDPGRRCDHGDAGTGDDRTVSARSGSTHHGDHGSRDHGSGNAAGDGRGGHRHGSHRGGR